jgi:hypothetical protein
VLNNNQGLKVADVQVFKAGDFYYLTLSYALNGGVVSNRGHVTTIDTDPEIWKTLSGGIKPQIFIESRGNNTAHYDYNVEVTPIAIENSQPSSQFAPQVSSLSITPRVSSPASGGDLKLTVTQEANQEDIGTFMVRLAKKDSEGNTVAQLNTVELAKSDLSLFTSTVRIPQDANAVDFLGSPSAKLNDQVSLPVAFGSGSFSSQNALWTGTYRSRSSNPSVKVADVQVFEDTTHYYLVLRYAIDSGSEFNRGHVTTVAMNGAIWSTLSGAVKPEIFFASRGSNRVNLTF